MIWGLEEKYNINELNSLREERIEEVTKLSHDIKLLKDVSKKMYHVHFKNTLDVKIKAYEDELKDLKADIKFIEKRLIKLNKKIIITKEDIDRALKDKPFNSGILIIFDEFIKGGDSKLKTNLILLHR